MSAGRRPDFFSCRAARCGLPFWRSAVSRPARRRGRRVISVPDGCGSRGPRTRPAGGRIGLFAPAHPPAWRRAGPRRQAGAATIRPEGGGSSRRPANCQPVAPSQSATSSTLVQVAAADHQEFAGAEPRRRVRCHVGAPPVNQQQAPAGGDSRARPAEQLGDLLGRETGAPRWRPAPHRAHRAEARRRCSARRR